MEQPLTNTPFQTIMARCEELRKDVCRNQRFLVEYQALWDQAHSDVICGLIAPHEALQVGRALGIVEFRLLHNYRKSNLETDPYP